LERVGAGAVYGGGPVEVGAGDAAGGSDFAEECAGVDEIAGLNGDGLEMAIEGVEAETVIEDHGVAGEIERLGEDYAAAFALRKRVCLTERGSQRRREASRLGH